MEGRHIDVGESIEITADHLALLRATWWGWQDCETGAPEIDPKRPYGNSNVGQDVVEILGWALPEKELEDGIGPIFDKALALHADLLPVMQIVASMGRIDPATYTRLDRAIGSHVMTEWEVSI